MKKKYAKPIKFKQAVLALIEYLNVGNGIDWRDQSEWKIEVRELRNLVDPKDHKKFDKIAGQLEFIGREMGNAWEDFRATVHAVDKALKEIIKKL
jgi:hypothetical protein